jgi:hypothetical protein
MVGLPETIYVALHAEALVALGGYRVLRHRRHVMRQPPRVGFESLGPTEKGGIEKGYPVPRGLSKAPPP